MPEWIDPMPYTPNPLGRITNDRPWQSQPGVASGETRMKGKRTKINPTWKALGPKADIRFVWNKDTLKPLNIGPILKK